ncbi:MAG: 4a-hydroxytetrahydrobiopterin dehydratase [Sumerlaeia bacterium]
MTSVSDKDVLLPNQVEDALTELPGWEYKNGHLCKQYLMKTFQDSIDFFNEAAELAQSINHHPDILVSYKKVKFMLWTHKFDAITTVDVELAKKVEELSVTQGLAL